MTRAEFVTALVGSGFDFLGTVDRNRFIDESAREFDAEELWPWRRVEVTGAAPLTVTTLGPIDQVVDAEFRTINPRRKSELREGGVDLTTAGNALYYYVEGNVVKTWPVSVTQITVIHFDQGGWITGDEAASGDADIPRADVRWHDAILLLARLRAKEFNDDYEDAARLWERYQARVEQARWAELADNADEPSVQRCNEVY